MGTDFLPSGISNTRDFETRKSVELRTLPVGHLSTLKEFQDRHQQVLFSPAIPYAWFHENHIDFDPLFSDLPDKFVKNVCKLSPLPADIVDGFYGNQAFWNRTLWSVPTDIWVSFCEHIGGKGYFDTRQKLVVLFSVGLSNADDVLAHMKGKPSGFIPVAHIDLHTNQYSIVMSESLNTTVLSIAKVSPDRQLQMFAEKFADEDSSAADVLTHKPRGKLKVDLPEVCGINDLSKANKKRFIELSEYYKQVFDFRESKPQPKEL